MVIAGILVWFILYWQKNYSTIWHFSFCDPMSTWFPTWSVLTSMNFPFHSFSPIPAKTNECHLTVLIWGSIIDVMPLTMTGLTASHPRIPSTPVANQKPRISLGFFKDLRGLFSVILDITFRSHHSWIPTKCFLRSINYQNLESISYKMFFKMLEEPLYFFRDFPSEIVRGI